MSHHTTSLKLEKCRICQSPNLVQILDFGNLVFSGFFPKSLKEPTPSGIVDLVTCENCGQTQLGYLFHAPTMYGENYGYMSQLNSSMKSHLEKIAQYIVNTLDSSSIKKVVDIGSNDGTLLNALGKLKPEIELIGIDPTIKKFGDNYSKNISKIPELFNENHVRELGKNSVQLVTTLAMFYDLDEPLKFVNNVHELLSDEGFWLIELTYGSWMKESLAFDTICHEHAVYYDLQQLVNIFSKNGFVFREVSLTDTNGKSLFIVLQKTRKEFPMPEFGEYLLAKEYLSNKDNLTSWTDFGLRVNERVHILRSFFENLKERVGPINGLGASTKGNILLQVLKLNSENISSIGEINQYKVGRVTPGTNIKIINEFDKEIVLNSSYLLVLPWHFKNSIINKFSSYLNNGGSLIFPLPELEIYKEVL
jgi:hypothetical protein